MAGMWGGGARPWPSRAGGGVGIRQGKLGGDAQ